MRRLDDGHAGRQEGPAPFRVLRANDPRFLSVSPPPPRAPEPYKVAPSTTSFGRSHRNSSFVIIAEPRPATPDSRSPSPTLQTGRVSPFRGRGFKGPPPRSRSRAQSPENTDERSTGRIERRGSLSQQYSPRRSLIPQPTRRRSISLSKTNDRSVSPKVGRRIDPKNRLSVSTSNINNVESPRRQLARPSAKLSPIQGTPTKPAEKSERNLQPVRRTRSRNTPRTSPAKTPRNSALPPKSVSNSRRTNQDRTSSRERLTSPSKIPLKTAPPAKNFGSTSSLNSNRFISKPNQSTDKAQNRKVERAVKETKDDDSQEQQSGQTGKSAGKSSEPATSQNNSANTDHSEDLVLLDLLKQSYNATGTSSVVNTTTATAVQPLKIDANGFTADKDGSEKKANQAKSKTDSGGGKSDNSSGVKEDSSGNVPVQNGSTNVSQKPSSNGIRSTNDKATSKNGKAGNGNQKARTGMESNVNSPAGTDSVGGHSKSGSMSQSVKNLSRVGKELQQMNSIGSAGQRSTGKNQVNTSDQNTKSAKTNGEKAVGESSSSSTTSAGLPNGVASVEGDSKTGTNSETGKANAGRDVHASETTVPPTSEAARLEHSEKKTAPKSTMDHDATTATAKMDRPDSQATTMNGKTNHVPANSTVDSVNVASGTNTNKKKRRDENRGSNASVKSSTGVSTGSDDSARSTDTGVSVNTVRGVSSPREKTGVHVVKRQQEIETLSGNVMHLEQNGEPALPASADVAGEARNLPEGLLTRWRKSLGRYCKCCSGMRCFACRRDPKGLLWPRNQQGTTMRTNAPPSNATEPPQPGCWTRFKKRCRCSYLRDVRCCARRARVAPAESTTCCPPERRFGAICRRLFTSCKCKRNDTQRRQSMRAKHSLTSVAPPPLSEEPKSKIPEVLVEHNSVMRGAIPCLPVPLAWFCLVWNVLLPGSGTVWSGIFNLCVGQPRFSTVAGPKSRLGAFIVNLIVGVGQLFTVLFCLVGWGWSIWWGVMMIRLARKYKRFKTSEAASSDPEARPGEPAAFPPGVPSQALHGMERVR